MHVHHGVVLHEVLTNIKVVALHFFLRAFDAAADDAIFNRHVFGQTEFVHEAHHSATAENAHQVVFHGNIELSESGVSLTSGSSAELIVDTARLVAFATNHAESAEFFHTFAEFNISSTTCHVGGNGHGAAFAGFRNDFRFLFMEFSVEHIVGHAFLFEQFGKRLGFFYGNGSHQHGLSFFVEFFYMLCNGTEFGAHVFINRIGFVLTRNGAVGRYFIHVESVNALEFFFLGFCGSRHSCQLFVEAEIVLKSNGGEGSAFTFNGHAFFGFNGLVEALSKTAALHETSGEFVHDQNFAVFYEVVHVRFIYGLCSQGLFNVVDFFKAFFGVNIFYAEQFFHLFNSFLSEHGAVLFFINIVVQIFFQKTHEFAVLQVFFSGFFGRGRNDERGAGFINQDAVHFVHNRVVQRALNQGLQTGSHVVTQVIEAEFVIGSVGDIRVVSGFFCIFVLTMNHGSHGEAKEAVEPTHPFGVTLSQVIVHRYHVHPFSFQCIEVNGQGTNQCFSFSGLHLGNIAFVQYHSSNHLHIEGHHVPGVIKAAHLPGFSHQVTAGIFQECKGFRQKVVHGLAISNTLLKFSRFFRNIGFREFGLVAGFNLVDQFHYFGDAFDLFTLMISEEFIENGYDGHCCCLSEMRGVSITPGFLGRKYFAKSAITWYNLWI